MSSYISFEVAAVEKLLIMYKLAYAKTTLMSFLSSWVSRTQSLVPCRISLAGAVGS
jgi:hypothetical protein